MENNTKQINKKVFRYCELCKVNTETPAKWIKHIETQRHKRNGKPKNTIYKCNLCPYEHKNKTNYNIHYITQHGTDDEKKQYCKYYCEICNIGIFSKLYYDNHIKSKKHNNMRIIINIDNK
jgi:hypothetical protein